MSEKTRKVVVRVIAVILAALMVMGGAAVLIQVL